MNGVGQHRMLTMAIVFSGILFLVCILIARLFVQSPQHQVMKSTNLTKSSAAVPGNDAYHLASLHYGVHLHENKAKVDFNGKIRVGGRISGQACFSFKVPNNAPRYSCPYPYIRLRLSGSALINVNLKRAHNEDISNSSMIELAGCCLLIPGVYYVEAHLLACSCDPLVQSSSELMRACTPISPDLSKIIRPFNFTVKPVDSMLADQATKGVVPRKNLFPHAAWVYAPLCKGSKYAVSSSCTTASSTLPSFVPTKFQIGQWLVQNNYSNWASDQKLIERMDDYVWLPINSKTGQPEYAAVHATPQFTPSLSGLDPFHSQDTVCFVGASHARYIRNNVIQIFYNLTAEADACNKSTMDDSFPDPVQHRFRLYGISMIPKSKTFGNLRLCNHVIVSAGQWDLSWAALNRTQGPAVPTQLLLSTLDFLRVLESNTPATSKTWVTSVNTNAMGALALNGKEWRTPLIIDAFNALLENATNRDTLQFKNLNRSFFLDNRDLMDPMWDSAADWCHPCRLVMRPIAHRVLALMRMN